MANTNLMVPQAVYVVAKTARLVVHKPVGSIRIRGCLLGGVCVPNALTACQVGLLKATRVSVVVYLLVQVNV